MFWMIVLSFVLMKKKRIRCYLSAGNPAPRPVLCPSLCLCRGEKSLSPYLKAQRKMHNRGRALSLLVTKVSLRRGEASCPTLLAGGPGCLDSPSLPPPLPPSALVSTSYQPVNQASVLSDCLLLSCVVTYLSRPPFSWASSRLCLRTVTRERQPHPGAIFHETYRCLRS